MYDSRSAIVVFNPKIPEHRGAVRDFMKRNAWGDTTLRFAYDPKYGSVAAQVQTKLLQHYLEQESEQL